MSFSFLSTGVKTPVLKEVGAFLISRILLKVLVRKEDINFLLFLRCFALIPYSSLRLFVFSLSIEFCTSSSEKGDVA